MLRIWVAGLFVIVSCSAPEKRFQADLAGGNCDDALVHLPDKDPLIKLAKQGQQAAGVALAYTFVGASYTAEVLWDVVGGTIMVVTLCSPLWVQALGGHEASTIACFPGKFDALGAPPLGRRAIASSQALHCPDLQSLSHSVRSVSSCYEAKGGEENLAKARRNLEAMKQSSDFYACLSEGEKKEIDVQLEGILKK